MRCISLLAVILYTCSAFAYVPRSRCNQVLAKVNVNLQTRLHLIQNEVEVQMDEKSNSIKWNYANVLLLTPMLSPLLAFLLSEVSNPMISGSERQLVVIGLLLSKRLYLYLSALGIVDLSSRVASLNFVPNIGEV